MDTNIYSGNAGGRFSLLMRKKALVIAAAAVLAAVIFLGGYFVWKYFYGQKSMDNLQNMESTANKIIDGALKGTLPSIQVNPLEEKPDMNPADKANPFKDIKINPF